MSPKRLQKTNRSRRDDDGKSGHDDQLPPGFNKGKTEQARASSSKAVAVKDAIDRLIGK